MQETFKSALAQTEAVLEKTEFTAYEKILFLSKSVGTAVASAYAGRHGIEAAHIYFTPVLESFPFMEKKGIVFHGTADQKQKQWTRDVKAWDCLSIRRRGPIIPWKREM